MTSSTASPVRSPSLRGEWRALWPFLLVVLAAWGVGVASQRQRAAAPPADPPWQHSYLELDAPAQRLYREVREGILEAENARAATGSWPSPQALAADGVPPFAGDGLTAPLKWTTRRHGIYVNYLGTPAEAGAQRWLVLFIEPEPGLLRGGPEAPPPVDEEHHTLPDGTALHVTVWTQPAEGPEPREVLAFPVSDGWVQRVGR